jgi:WhiB family redox-sensing transcriptional regulator
MFEWTDWRDGAACRDSDPEAFVLPLTPVGLRAAKSVCAGCPVVGPCLAGAAGDEDTVRGGLTPDQRRALRRVVA